MKTTTCRWEITLVPRLARNQTRSYVRSTNSGIPPDVVQTLHVLIFLHHLIDPRNRRIFINALKNEHVAWNSRSDLDTNRKPESSVAEVLRETRFVRYDASVVSESATIKFFN